MHKLMFGLQLISIRRTLMTATASLAVFGASGYQHASGPYAASSTACGRGIEERRGNTVLD